MKKLRIANQFLAQAAELLREGKSVKLRIDGRSMLPFIRGIEDEVVIIPINAKEIPRWSCLFCVWNGQYIVHRYIDKSGDEYVLMGDGNLIQKESVAASDVLGLLSEIHHKDGRISDCLSNKCLKKGKRWYRMRHFRQILLLFGKFL